MSFIDKLKSGMTEAGNKAKILVEQNKLKLANVSKQTQIEKLYKEIGAKVTKRHLAGEQFSTDDCKQELEAISILLLEIEQNEIEIAQLSDEKVCKQCGKDNTIVAKVCIHCNAPFDIIDANAPPHTPVYLEENTKEEK